MKTLIINFALILTTLPGFSQNLCATNFKRNNGNGTCSSLGQLRLTFPGECPTDVPMIDSLYINGVKINVTFAAPDNSTCGGTNGYIGYCVTSGNMPPADVWRIFFRTKSGVKYSCDVLDAWINILPVKFVSFDGTVSGNGVTCKWTTEEEINNDRYELERSFDGINFNTIAIVFGEGTEKTVRNSYKYTDKASSLQNRNVVYYRVKQIDNNGKFSYTNTISVKLGATESKSIQASPNPFADNLALKFEATEKGTAQIRILSFTGQAVTTTNAIVHKGLNNLQIDNLTGLAKGVYVAQVSIDGVIVGNQKVVKN
jgi:Secretion system C-terminal sorting domain